MRRRMLGIACVALAGTTMVSGCEFTGLNDFPLPLTQGSSDEAYTVTVEMDNAVNLVPNSEVKVNDLTVGSVRAIDFENWHARLTVGLNRDVVVPANAVARIGQKSLLGAEYLELAPPTTEPPVGRLRDGDAITLRRTERYPETEEVLAALSLVLNGGGLAQVETITTELNNMLGGREDDVRELLSRLDAFIGSLNAQRDDLVRAIEGLDRLSATLADQKRDLDRGLDTIPPGLEALNRQRADLTRTLTALSHFSQTATRVVDSGREDLVDNVRDLRPVLRELADAGRDLPETTGIVTFPFPANGVLKAFKGDYINYFATIDLTYAQLDKAFLSGTPLQGQLAAISGLPGAVGPAAQRNDPFRAPLQGPPPSQPPPGPMPPPAWPSAPPAPAPSAPPAGVLDPLLGGDGP